MPELAEVEYVAREMRELVIGVTIAQVQVAWPGIIAHPDVPTFIAAVTGARILAVDRRAKLLLIYLSGDSVLTVHRRMSGNLELLDPGAPDLPYLRAAFTLADGRRILYTDPRKFGRLALWNHAELAAQLAAFGPEPLDPAFTSVQLATCLSAHDRAIKATLLDQHVIAGLGNIYADEALHRAGIHPLRSANALAPAEIDRLHDAIVAVLEQGIVHGGTTFGRHRGFTGEAGTNLDHIAVYQHTNRPCATCGTPIERIIVAQRGTHFCPHCQPASPSPVASKLGNHHGRSAGSTSRKAKGHHDRT